jgi:bacteriocin-like protein
MDKKNLIPQVVLSVNHINIQDLPSEMVELSEEEMSQITGGWVNYQLWLRDQVKFIYDSKGLVRIEKVIDPGLY